MEWSRLLLLLLFLVPCSGLLVPLRGCEDEHRLVIWRTLALSSGIHHSLAVPPSSLICVAATQDSSRTAVEAKKKKKKKKK